MRSPSKTVNSSHLEDDWTSMNFGNPSFTADVPERMIDQWLRGLPPVERLPSEDSSGVRCHSDYTIEGITPVPSQAIYSDGKREYLEWLRTEAETPVGRSNSAVYVMALGLDSAADVQQGERQHRQKRRKASGACCA